MRKQAYIIRNQHRQYLDSQSQWAAADSGETPFFSPHRDVAVNRLFELTLADVALRGQVLACPLDERGRPLLALVDETETPETATPETAAPETAAPETEAATEAATNPD